MELFFILHSLFFTFHSSLFTFNLFQHPGKSFQVAWVGIHVEHGAITVNEFVGWERVNLKVILNGTLLGFRQVVVNDVVTHEVVLLDDVLPRLIIAAVGKVEIDEVEVLQSLVFFL